MLFIEQDAKRFDVLQSTLAPYRQRVGASSNVRDFDAESGDCDSVLNGKLDEFERKGVRFARALAFLDQFGYGAVSMGLIKRILACPQCEVFTYLSYKEMNRWITDEHKAPAFTRAYGGEEWRDCIDLPERQRREKLLELYKTALRNRGGATYVVSFLMFDRNGAPLYWLIFCTHSLKGLEEMKKAMWAADETGQCQFSDHDNPEQLTFLKNAFDQEWLANELSNRLAGQTLTTRKVWEFVLVETPCYLFKGALSALESEERIEILSAPIARKQGKFNDEWLDQIVVRFSKELF
jgi:three-Cys-motif partner protein